MRILLTNHHCFHFGGTENYTVDLARYYQSQGHTVAIYIHIKSPKMVAYEYFQKKYPSITWYIAELPPDNFDLLLLNHNPTLTALKGYSGFKICTTHGHPQLEKFAAGADHYVCISQELFDFYTGIPNKTLIPTGFYISEIQEFEYKEKLDSPSALLIDYTASPQSLDNFQSTCKKLGIWGEAFQCKNITPFGITHLYRNYDIICATGRTALEAVFSNKRTVVYSHFGCDGIFRHEVGKCNYSGRYYNDLSTLEATLRSILTLSKKDFNTERKKVMEERQIKKVANSYLGIFKENR